MYSPVSRSYSRSGVSRASPTSMLASPSSSILSSTPISSAGYNNSTGYLRPSGSYDIAGVWRPDVGLVYDDVSTRYPFGTYGSSNNLSPHGIMYNTYDPYNALSDYEENLRLSRDISEEERLRRWEARLRFEELEEEERMRRWERMAEEERLRLGLRDYRSRHQQYRRPRRHSQNYNRSYAHGSPSYNSPQNRGWDSHRLPLSSSLSSRFDRYGSAGYSHHHGRSLGDSVRFSIDRDRASLAGLSDAERRRVVLDMEDNRRSRVGNPIGGAGIRPGMGSRRRSRSVPGVLGGALQGFELRLRLFGS